MPPRYWIGAKETEANPRCSHGKGPYELPLQPAEARLRANGQSWMAQKHKALDQAKTLDDLASHGWQYS